MKTNWDKYGRRLDWKRVGLGVAVGFLTMLILTALCAWMLEREMVGLEWVNYLAVLILLLGSFVAAKTVGGSGGRWLHSAVVAAGLWIVMLSVNALLFGSNPGGAGETALAIMGGCGGAALLSGKRTVSRGRKRRNR